MNKLIGTTLLFVICCCRFAPAAPCTVSDPRVSDRIIVRISDGFTFEIFQQAFTALHPKFSVQPLSQLPNRPIYLASINAPLGALDALEAEIELGYGGILAWGEFVYLDEGPEGTTGSIFVDRPIDIVSFQTQYSGSLLGLEPAHQYASGQGTVVAVLDTGITTSHSIFTNRIVTGGYDFVDLDADPSEVQDAVDHDNDGFFDEGWGHGTFVSSIILLVAPDAKILPLRILNSDGVGTSWDLASAMFYAIDRGVEVINISVGSTYHSIAIDDAVDETKALGIVVVAAAGNCNRADPRTFPAMQSNIVGVVATDVTDVLANFSNYGDLVSIAAPGSSTNFDLEPLGSESLIGAIPNGGFAYWQGTSMSAPLVSGAFALIRNQHPELTTDSDGWNFQVDTVLGTATNIDAINPGFIGLLGSGRLDVDALVSAGPVAPMLGDINADGVIDVLDLLLVITDWGKVHSSADLDSDGLVGVLDILIVIDQFSL